MGIQDLIIIKKIQSMWIQDLIMIKRNQPMGIQNWIHDQEEPANWNTGFEVIILQYKTCRLNASTFTNPKQSEWVLTSMWPYLWSKDHFLTHTIKMHSFLDLFNGPMMKIPILFSLPLNGISNPSKRSRKEVFMI